MVVCSVFAVRVGITGSIEEKVRGFRRKASFGRKVGNNYIIYPACLPRLDKLLGRSLAIHLETYHQCRSTAMTNVNIQTTISPYTQEPVCTRPLLSGTELDTVITQAVKAQKAWKKVPLDDRIAIAEKWLVSTAAGTWSCLLT